MLKSSTSDGLRLRAGEWVGVRPVEEILRTLDGSGRLDGLPFMPEMIQFCGQRFRVYKSAHKACDTVGDHGCLRMDGAVHLEGIRCDGSAHGGCQAGCLIFWKDAWLKTVDPRESETNPASAARSSGERRGVNVDLESLARATRAPNHEPGEVEVRYSCQATSLLDATTPLRWWDLRQYVTDITSGNVSLRDFLRYSAIAIFNMIMRRLRFERRHAYPAYPYVPGVAGDKTPTQVLDLQPGELVEVRSRDEIMRTINRQRKNRGLSFDVEMEPYCGKTHRVLRRVQRIIDEKTGKMINISRDCLILDGVICGGCLSRSRLFCPRSIYPYWREIWLRRKAPAPSGQPVQRQTVDMSVS